MDEYAETIDFPVKWDIGAPMPHLLSNGSRTLLLFYLKDNVSEDVRTESIALVEFLRCVSAKLGTPNEDVLRNHSLHGKGLKPYTAQVVKNSRWVKELDDLNKAHSDYSPEFWRSLNHYVLWFHDETFECVAKSYEVEVFQKTNPQESMVEVIMEAVKRLRAQHSVHPTGGSLRVFKQFAWLEVGPVKVALSRPAHPRVTQTVGWLIENSRCDLILENEACLITKPIGTHNSQNITTSGVKRLANPPRSR